MSQRRRNGLSIVGLLVTLACILILAVVLMTALNKATTGEGSAREGTVRSFQDQLYLRSLYQSLATASYDFEGRYLTPSELTGTRDTSLNTTANLFSAMVMNNYSPPSQLISGNEYNPWVEEDVDYNMTLYDPSVGVYWDPDFAADLDVMSNTSFAHVPLYGERFGEHWRNTMSSTFPILGNRGPKDGVNDPSSYTYGRNGIWGGHIVFGDGSIDFINTFTPGSVYYEADGQRLADNIFAVDTTLNGIDAILSFTKAMTRNGPELQHD